jgi:hypothetical protein
MCGEGSSERLFDDDGERVPTVHALASAEEHAYTVVVDAGWAARNDTPPYRYLARLEQLTKRLQSGLGINGAVCGASHLGKKLNVGASHRVERTPRIWSGARRHDGTISLW